MSERRKEPALPSLVRHLISWAHHHTGGSPEEPEVAAARLTVHRSSGTRARATGDARR